MESMPEKSVNELREESERSRDALANTVTELRDRVGDTASEIKTIVSPTYIKREIRDYVRQERESLVDAVQRKAKDNPLQVAAIAAAVAYPALGLLRALPAPLWLIGAGLFLTSKRGHEVSEDVKTRVDDVVQQASEKVSDLAGSVRSDLEDRMAGVRYGIDEARDAVNSTVGGAADKTVASFHEARDAVKDAVQAGTSKATAAGQRLSATVSESADAVKKRADDTVRTSRYAVTDFVTDNALLIAGIGAAVGAVIAASIPPSDAENRLFGGSSGKLKEKAREAAAQGIEKIGDIAADTAGTVAAAATREGLDAAGVQTAIKNVADSVRTVADRGLDKALGKKQDAASISPFDQSPIERNPS